MSLPVLRPIAALIACAIATAPLGAQQAIPVAEEFNALHFRSIGPATMSGRIADIAIYEANPAIWYVATAHGGLWKTTSHGVTWTPMMQDKGLMSFGDVTISQGDPNLVWAGGGESNNRQSTSWGSGVWKSTDGGATWTNMGLKESKHIHRIAIDPRDDNVVYVAATGPLFGPGGDRGVFKTTDGGRTWRKVLTGDENTGANDVVIAPKDPDVVFASMYQRRREACCMNGGGPGSALYRSTDRGETWSKVEGGFPTGPLGRIAVDVSRSDPSVVFALVEAPGAAPTAGQQPGGMQPSAAASGNTGLWRSNDGGTTWTKVNSINPRPMYFSKVLIDPTNTETVYYGGVGLHMSIDGGRTVETDAALVTHDDIHALWVNPSNPLHIIIGNDGGIAVSHDQAKSWQFVPNLPVGLFYHVSYDNAVPFNVCGGMQDNYNWCGPSRSRFGRGIQNYDWFQILGGDGFHAIPAGDGRTVYTESQNGNMVRRDILTGELKSIRPTLANVVPRPDSAETYRFQWDAPMLLSPHDPNVLIVAGNKMFVSRDRGDSWEVRPQELTSNLRRDTLRTMGVLNTDIRIARNDGIQDWPAVTTLAESPARAGVMWSGSDDGVVGVSMDFGATWRFVHGNMPGFPAGAYVGKVVPSKHNAARAYVAVPNYRLNDYKPYLWVTEDSGATFSRIDAGLAGEVVRTITEDPKNGDVLYVGTETGLFVTLDRGRNWRRFQANLPHVRIDEITIHPRDNAMLLASHGRSLWVLDNLAPVQELAEARSGTRTLWLFNPGRALQWKYKDDRNDEFWGHQFFTGENPPAEAVFQWHALTAPRTLALRVMQGNTEVRVLEVPEAKRQPGIHAICWDMRFAPIAPVQTGAGGPGGPGGGQGGPGGQGAAQARPVPGVRAPLPEVGYLPLNPCAPAQGQGGGGGGGGFGGGAAAMNLGPYVSPGTYTVSLVVDGATVDSKTLTVVADPDVKITGEARAMYDRQVIALHAKHREAADVLRRMTTLRQQLTETSARIDSVQGISTRDRRRYDEVRRTYDVLRVRFGLPAIGTPAPAVGGGGGGGGGGFGGFGVIPVQNTYGRFVALKAGVVGLWETPSAAIQTQLRDLQRELDGVLREANSLLNDATAAGRPLQAKGLTLAP